MTGFQWTWWNWNLIEDFRYMFQFQFVRDIYAAGTLIAILAGVVSYLVVLRRSSFASHALGHAGFSGAAGAVLFGVNPFYGLLAATIGSGTGIAILGPRASNRDVEIGTVLAFMLALGLLFLAFYNGYATEAYSILFGEIVGISPAQVLTTYEWGVPILLVLLYLYRQLLFASLDEEVADAKGMHTTLLGFLFMIALAIAISVAVTVIGVLLIFALTVTPAAIAIRLAKRPRNAVFISIGVALLATWAGSFVAFYESPAPTSFFIVLIVFALYLVVRALPLLRRARTALFASAARSEAPPLAGAGPEPASAAPTETGRA
jgi:zinc/manganese transport system permease protein